MAVAEFRHFGRAAAHLNITQPAITKRIVALENSLGGKLFERSGGGSRPTAMAEAMLADTVGTIAAIAALERTGRELAKGAVGRLEIGFGLSTIDVALRIIAEYRARYPHVMVSLDDHSSAEQVDRLLSRRLDVGFVGLPVPQALASQPLLHEQLVLATSAATHGRDLDAFNVRGFVALRRSRGPGLAHQIDRWGKARKFLPRVTQTVDDIQTVLALFAAGVGHALLPSRAAKLLSSQVQLLPLDGRTAHWQVGAAWRRRDQSPALKRFIALFAQQ